MRCPKQPSAEEAQQARLLQQLGGPGMFWPPYPPAPQSFFNPWMASQHPMLGPVPPQSQFPPQMPGPGERPSWFQGLVAAVSKEIKDSEKKAAAEGARKKDAAPEGLSVEDEKVLIDALRRQREGQLTMEQVFVELNKKYGHTELEWKTLFFANYERLISQADAHCAPGQPASADDPSASRRSSLPVASRTRSASRHEPSRSSTGTASRTPSDSDSFEESESESESDSDSDSESGLDWDKLSYCDKSDSSPQAPAPRADATRTGTAPTPATSTAKPARGAKACVRVTDADLRRMAQYRCEHGDDSEPGRYSTPRWQEFARRPENYKRTLSAWTCVPRNSRHAAAIDRYVKEYRQQAEVAEPESKPVLPIRRQPPQPGNSFVMASSRGAGMQGQDIASEAKQKVGADRKNGGRGGMGSGNRARRRRNADVDRMDIIELTD